MKKIWGNRLATVMPRQGSFALDPQIVVAYPPADLTIESIGELADYDLNGCFQLKFREQMDVQHKD